MVLPSSPVARPSPGMQHFTRQVAAVADVSHLCSRAAVLRMPNEALGPSTEDVRRAAVASVLAAPMTLRDAQHRPEPAVAEGLTSPSATPQALAAAQKLLPLLPEECFIEMAGGAAAYRATPLAERQQANLRTLCAAVGRRGDAGFRLASLISKLHDYRRLREIPGDCWPLYPCIISNFAVWLQVNSPKHDATSVAPRCVQTFVSAARSVKLPVIVDSPHLGAVPAHQTSGDGWTGHLPLDIARELERWTCSASPPSPAMAFDFKAAYEIWAGSCRVQDWAEVSPASTTYAPLADAVYKISITKNGERNTLFAVPSEGIAQRIPWRNDFAALIRKYGPCPATSSPDLASPGCVLLLNTKLDSKDYAKRVYYVILFCARRLGYSKADLQALHIYAHALHGSLAAYSEAMEWHFIPMHKLGRWRIPASRSAVVPVRQHRGAGKAGAKSIPAVYSTAASCQVQLDLRARMFAALRAIGEDFSTHADLSCFISNERLIALGFRGPHGHEVRAGQPSCQHAR